MSTFHGSAQAAVGASRAPQATVASATRAASSIGDLVDGVGARRDLDRAGLAEHRLDAEALPLGRAEEDDPELVVADARVLQGGVEAPGRQAAVHEQAGEREQRA